jgi:hypothetical protein
LFFSINTRDNQTLQLSKVLGMVWAESANNSYWIMGSVL